MNNRSAIVSIIGRPNVGKSSIFNRLMRKAFLSMSYDIPGVTRDRHYGVLHLEESATLPANDLILVDTGGFYPEKIKIEMKKNNIDPFFNLMADHAKMAIQESDLVLFVVDVREGLNPFDEMIVQVIREHRKPFWLLVNKFDTEKQTGDEIDFYKLGVSEENLFLVSAEHARGLNSIRDSLQEFVSKLKLSNDEEELIRKGIKPRHDVVGSVAIIGAPNSGKSTLLNTLVGTERALVSDIAGTTVDPIEGYIDLYFYQGLKELAIQKNDYRKDPKELLEELKKYQARNGDLVDFDEDIDEKILIDFDADFPADDIPDLEEDGDFDIDGEIQEEEFTNEIILESEGDDVPVNPEPIVIDEPDCGYRSVKIVDTAGIRRMKLVEGFIEEQSVYRSLKSITEADVVICMIDATIGITHQDRRLCDIALEKGKSILIVLNKIDLMWSVFNDQKKRKEWLKNLERDIPWLGFCEIITISAKRGARLNHLKKSLEKTILVRHKKISTPQLNKVLTHLVDAHPVVIKKSNGSRFKVKYASMIKSNPPTFLLFSNKSMGIPENYRKYLVSGLRKDFKLINTPVHLIFRTSTDLERRMKKLEARITK